MRKCLPLERFKSHANTFRHQQRPRCKDTATLLLPGIFPCSLLIALSVARGQQYFSYFSFDFNRRRLLGRSCNIRAVGTDTIHQDKEHSNTHQACIITADRRHLPLFTQSHVRRHGIFISCLEHIRRQLVAYRAVPVFVNKRTGISHQTGGKIPEGRIRRRIPCIPAKGKALALISSNKQ